MFSSPVVLDIALESSLCFRPALLSVVFHGGPPTSTSKRDCRSGHPCHCARVTRKESLGKNRTGYPGCLSVPRRATSKTDPPDLRLLTAWVSARLMRPAGPWRGDSD